MSSMYEPKSRIHHFVASVGKKCYMYGGSHPLTDKRQSFVEIFDQESKTWTKQLIENPPSVKEHTRGACCSIQSDVYFYGGFIGYEPCDHLFKLVTTRLELIKLSPGGNNGPIKKAGCQMVVFHKTKLALYGGQSYRNLISSPQQLSRIMPTGSIWCITNEFHVFDTLTGN